MNTFLPVQIAWFFYSVVITFTLLKASLIVRQMQFVWRHKDHVPASFSTRITAEEHLLAANYTVAKLRLTLLQLGLELAVILVATALGGLQQLSLWWDSHLSSVLLRNVALIASVMILMAVLELPIDLYRKFVLEQRFGFNTTRISGFLKDLVLQTLIAAALGMPLLAAVLWMMSRAGSLWWLDAWIVWLGFNLFLLMIYPVWIAPLFNRFEPMPIGPLKDKLAQLLERCQFAAEGLYVMDGSRRSRHGNAFFTGFGKNRRIVLFDTLMQQLSDTEIEAVLAHELGHFHYKHVLRRMISIFLMSLFVLWCLAQVMQHAELFVNLHVNMANSGQALVLMLLVLPALSLPAQLLSGLTSRRQEFQADGYAAKMVGAEPLIQALVCLYRDNATSLSADPWYSLFFDSHPNAQQRVAHLSALVHNN